MKTLITYLFAAIFTMPLFIFELTHNIITINTSMWDVLFISLANWVIAYTASKYIVSKNSHH